MTKQILAFLFCFIRELTLYSPLTYSLTSARELKPILPPYLLPPPTYPPIPSTTLLKFVYFEQKWGFNELNLRLRLIFVTADKVGMNRSLNLGLLGHRSCFKDSIVCTSGCKYWKVNFDPDDKDDTYMTLTQSSKEQFWMNVMDKVFWQRKMKIMYLSYFITSLISKPASNYILWLLFCLSQGARD